LSGHEGTKSRRKLYTARKNKIVHFFVDNQWFSAEKLYTPEESGHSVPVQVYGFAWPVVSILPKKNRDIMIFVYSFLNRFYPHLLNNLFFV